MMHKLIKSASYDKLQSEFNNSLCLAITSGTDTPFVEFPYCLFGRLSVLIEKYRPAKWEIKRKGSNKGLMNKFLKQIHLFLHATKSQNLWSKKGSLFSFICLFFVCFCFCFSFVLFLALFYFLRFCFILFCFCFNFCLWIRPFWA